MPVLPIASPAPAAAPGPPSSHLYSRRGFLTAGALAAAGLVLLDPFNRAARAAAAAQAAHRAGWPGAGGPTSAAAAPPPAYPGGMRPVEHMTLPVFQRMHGDTVQLQSPTGERFQAKVVEATDHTGAHTAYQQYSVLFRADLRQPYPQGNYTLTHPREGSCVLFLVPILSHEPGTTYEAIFTRPL